MKDLLKLHMAHLRALFIGLTHTRGVFSHTKTFSSLAYSVATWVVIHQELNNTQSVEMMLVFLGTVGAHNILLRKWAPDKEAEVTEEKK